MNNLITLNYEGSLIQADNKAWFNATQVAATYGKIPYEWLRLPETKRYIDALCRKYESGKSLFVKTVKGGNTKSQGTWLHPKLAVPFARWLDVDFSIWCDEQVETILSNAKKWQFNRISASKSYQMMSDALYQVKTALGQPIGKYDYSNEACRVNRALTGKWGKLDREKLTKEQLDIVDSLLVYNSALIHQLKPPVEREASMLLYVQRKLGNQLLMQGE